MSADPRCDVTTSIFPFQYRAGASTSYKPQISYAARNDFI